MGGTQPSGQSKPIGERNLFGHCPLQLGQRAIEDVTGVGEAEQLASIEQASGDDRQYIVATVSTKDLIGLHPKQLRSLHPKWSSQWIGISLQPTSRLGDCLADLRRWRIGIFVRVELDRLAPGWLLPRLIGSHALHISAKPSLQLARIDRFQIRHDEQSVEGQERSTKSLRYDWDGEL
jgi:hypothetical protein